MNSLARGQVLVNEDFDTWTGELPKGWVFQGWHNDKKAKISKHERDKGNSVCISGVQAPDILNSFSYQFCGVKKKIEKELLVSFDYKFESANMPLFVALSSGPGCSAPAIKNFPRFIYDGKWHRQEIVFYTDGLVNDDAVIEFILEGAVKEIDKVYIGNVIVRQNILPKYDAFLFSPGSLTMIDKTPTNKVGIELTSRKGTACFVVSVRQQNEDNVLLEKEVNVSSSQKYWLDLSDFAVGKYKILVVNKGGNELGKWIINKVPFKKNSSWCKDNVPYVNGKPFLILGIFHAGDPELAIVNRDNKKLGKPAIARKQMLKDIKQHGFNTTIHGWRVASSDFMKDALNNDIMVISENLSRNVNEIERIKNEPAVLGWYAFDEPTTDKVDFCIRSYEAYRKKDPYHFVTVAFNAGGLGFGRERFADAPLPDAYPIRNKDSGVGTIATFVKTCYEQINYDPAGTVIPVIQLFTSDSWNSFEPNPQQVRAETFTALTAGAKGFLYYAWYTNNESKKGMSKNRDRTYWFLPESEKLWDYIPELLREVKSYENFILFGKDTEHVKVLPKTATIHNRTVMFENEVLVVVVNSDGKKADPIKICWPAKWPDPTILSGPNVSSKKRTMILSGYEVSILKFKL